MRKFLSFLLLGMLLSVGNVWGAEGDTHDFTQTLQQLLNNNATIASIEIPAQSYSVKKVIISYRYNKTIENPVTIAISVDGTSWGTTGIEGTGSNYTTCELAGDAAIGPIVISFTNNTGSGTGHGTFYVNNVQLVEGPTLAPAPFVSATPSTLAFGNVLKDSSVDPKIITVSFGNLTGGVSYSGLSAPFTATGTIANPGDEISVAVNTSNVGDFSQTLTIQSAADSKSATVEVSMKVVEAMTVAEANAALAGQSSIDDSFVHGIISQIDSYSSSYKSITYWISDDGTTSGQLEVFSGKGLNGADFNTVNDLHVGDEVTVYGDLTIYNQTKEFASGNIIVAFNRPAIPSIDVASYSVAAPSAGKNGTINIIYENLPISAASDFDIQYYDNEDNEISEPDWIASEVEYDENYQISYVIDANTGAARTAYMKVYALDNNSNIVYSSLITISQAEYFEIVDGLFDFVAAGAVGEDYGSGVPFSTGEYVTDNKTWTAGNVTMVTGKASGNGYRWWDADKTLRFYNGSHATFSVPSGYLITKIVTTGASFDVADKGSLNTSTFTWTGADNNIKFSVTATRNIKTITVSYVKTTFTLGTNGWSTFSAPFKFAVSGAEVYMAAPDAELNATKVILSKVENGIVPAEEGVILKGTEGATVTITPTDAEASDYNDSFNKLMNTAVAPAVASVGSNMYVLATDNNVTAFYPCGNITIPMYKAWMFIFPAQQGGAPEAIRIEFAENNATDIKSVEGSEKAVKFIENGKLYIQKDGVVYDVTGAVVR